jgi:transposase
MNKISVIGLDLAKNVFQLHGVDADGKIVVRKQLSRSQLRQFLARLEPCLIGMEACGGAHYWSRELTRAGAYRSNDGTGLCEAVPEVQQERSQ